MNSNIQINLKQKDQDLDNNNCTNNCTDNCQNDDTTLEIINMLNNVFDLTIQSRLSTPSPVSINNIQPFNEDDELNFIFNELCIKKQNLLNDEDNLNIVNTEECTDNEKEFYQDFVFNNLCEKYKELLEEDCDINNIINKNNLNNIELEVYQNLIENN